MADALNSATSPDNETERVKMVAIEYGQLHPVRKPNISGREPPANDPSYVPATWETYTVTAKSKEVPHVQAPEAWAGAHFEVKHFAIWPWSVRLIGTVDCEFGKDRDGAEAAGINYAFKLGMTKRSARHAYDETHKTGQWAISVCAGDLNASTGNFVPWENLPRQNGHKQAPLADVAVDATDLMGDLFCQCNAKSPDHRWPMYGNATDDVMRDDPNDAPVPRTDGTARYRFNLEPRGGEMCMYGMTAGSKEMEWISMCNFELLRLDKEYMFTESDCGDPFALVVCRLHLNPNGNGTAYLPHTAETRTPSVHGYQHLDVEVLVQIGYLRTSTDVKKLFQLAHPNLKATTLTPDMLACWMAEQPRPPITSCIVRFGRQAHSGSGNMFVSGNLVFDGGEMKTLDAANIAIVPQHFKDSACPTPKSDYPRHVIIPQCHVRYAIGMNFWKHLLPQFFQNNEMPARATFAFFVMGLYATKIWDGELVGHGFPFAWAYSTEPNTGKTEAMLAGNAMIGFFRRQPWAGDTTKSALNERLSQQCDLTVAVDDVVVNASAPESRVYQQMGRSLYDRTTRAVTNKIRRPNSSALFTVRAARLAPPCSTTRPRPRPRAPS